MVRGLLTQSRSRNRERATDCPRCAGYRCVRDGGNMTRPVGRTDSRPKRAGGRQSVARVRMDRAVGAPCVAAFPVPARGCSEHQSELCLVRVKNPTGASGEHAANIFLGHHNPRLCRNPHIRCRWNEKCRRFRDCKQITRADLASIFRRRALLHRIEWPKDVVICLRDDVSGRADGVLTTQDAVLCLRDDVLTT